MVSVARCSNWEWRKYSCTFSRYRQRYNWTERAYCWKRFVIHANIHSSEVVCYFNIFVIVYTDAAQKWSKLKQTIKSDRSAFVVAFTKTKEQKNKIRIAQVITNGQRCVEVIEFNVFLPLTSVCIISIQYCF